MTAKRHGFTWDFPSLDAALPDVIDGAPVDIRPDSSHGAKFVLTANQEYWGGRPKLDRIERPVVKDPQTAHIIAYTMTA